MQNVYGWDFDSDFGHNKFWYDFWYYGKIVGSMQNVYRWKGDESSV